MKPTRISFPQLQTPLLAGQPINFSGSVWTMKCCALSFCQMPNIIQSKAATKLGDICQELAKIYKTPGHDLTMEQFISAKSQGFRLASIIFQNSNTIGNFTETGELYQRLAPTLKYLREEHPERISLNRMARMSNLSVIKIQYPVPPGNGSISGALPNPNQNDKSKICLIKNR